MVQSGNSIFACTEAFLTKTVISNDHRLNNSIVTSTNSPCSIALHDSIISLVCRDTYVGDSVYSIEVHDVNRQLIQISGIASTSPFFAVALTDNQLIASTMMGLSVFDLSVPYLNVVGRFPIQGIAYDVRFSGNLAFVASSTSGLRIIDASSPLNMREIGYYSLPDNQGIRKLTLTDSIAFVYGANSFHIFSFADCVAVNEINNANLLRKFSLHPNYPNPFNATTTIEYTIPKMGKVDLKVFDITGREVATLVNFHQNPGSYQIKFDGTTLATGTYFVRLQSGEFTQTRKMVLLR
ncbi:MAG: T9SS type A sorting domain-containing protein [bacterium]|nr:T9SS type A sorting domain-containing protein [bacterium]